MKNHLTFSLSIALLAISTTACKKEADSKTYFGTVRAEIVSCTGPTGRPYIIDVLDNEKLDSVATLTLPSSYKAVGTAIKFKIRELETSDYFMICTTNIIAPKQVIVYEVSEN
ncbi:hypothetical protein [Desertivirga arenae]|uniref:hypothetical protein n=1 Tax=Desertivirga arenae TaxID=2810309 RepID=UPI001A95D1DE|nr:hypothetical protein [Pedobacter sp. SYSU D00823]